MSIVLWTALILAAYAYVGFPILLFLRGIFFSRPVSSAAITPRVSVIIAAHNEAATIESKLQNVGEMDYPADKLEVIVVSDGSDDGTNEKVAEQLRPGIHLLELPRAGKYRALNAAVAQATGEILIFSDANSMYSPDALRELVAPFADLSVGAVGGNQRYVPEGSSHLAANGELLYWDYDRLLKTLQSRAGSMTSATGAIHAIRSSLFREVPPAVSDDFAISTLAIRAGYRLCFAERAIAYETVAVTAGAEFQRKVRIMTRAMRAVWTARELLNPFRFGFYAVQLFSHKVLRWSVCWLQLVVFVTSALLARDSQSYWWLLVAQLAVYGCATLAVLLRRLALEPSSGLLKLLEVPFFFCMANYAAFRAWLRFLRGAHLDVWDSQRADNVKQPLVGT